MTTESFLTKESLKDQWLQIFRVAIETDTWGQVEESIAEYKKLVHHLEQGIPQVQNLSVDERSILMKTKQAITLRIKGRTDFEGKMGISIKDIKEVHKALTRLYDEPNVAFPIDLSGYSLCSELNIGPDNQILPHGSIPDNEKTSTISQRPKLKPGQTAIAVFIDRIGLKDAQTYIDARITVTAVDKKGNRMNGHKSQDTPKSSKTALTRVEFGEYIYLQSPLEDFSNGSSIFFEFKHYKPKKKKLSTRCFTFMEYSEIIRAKNDDSKLIPLELYKKPTDFTRRRISLFTVKRLYLHVQLTFHKH